MLQTQSATATETNRRDAMRRQPTIGTVCRLTYGATGKPHLGLVWNLSCSGVSMLLDAPPESGTVLSAELATMDERSALPVKLRVVHIRAIRTGDYFLGAQFERPLNATEMRPFLAQPYPET